MTPAVFFRPILLLFILGSLTACTSQSRQAFNPDTLSKSEQYVAKATELMRAAQSGNVEAIRAALLAGDLLNAYSPQGNAFSMALKEGHFAIANFLLKIGARFDRGFEEKGDSALIIASANGRNDLVKQLIVKGASINYATADGHTAIARAAINRHLTTMNVLINAGADVNVVADGKSVLMYSVLDNNPLLVQVLIAAGADVNYRAENGDTALRLARRGGYYDLDLMLVQAGARL